MANPPEPNELVVSPTTIAPSKLTRLTILSGCLMPLYAIGGLTFASWWRYGGRALPTIVVVAPVLVVSVWLARKAWAVRLETRPGSVRVVNMFSDNVLPQADVRSVDIAGCKRMWLQLGKHPALRFVTQDGSSTYADASLSLTVARRDALLSTVRADLGL